MGTFKVITHAVRRARVRDDPAARHAAITDEMQRQKAELALEIGGLTRKLVALAGQRSALAPEDYDAQRRYLKRQLRALKGAFASYGNG